MTEIGGTRAGAGRAGGLSPYRTGSGGGAPRAPRRRLLLVVDSLETGGAERHVADLAASLAARGHDVTVACSVAGVFAAPLEAAGVAVRPLVRRLVKRRLSVRLARALRRLVRTGSFDLVHAHLYASASAAALATLGTGVPLVVTEHTEGHWRRRRHRHGSRFVYRRASVVIAVSNAIRALLAERYGVPRTKVACIPPGTAPSPAPPKPRAPTAGGKGVVVGHVGRLQPEKGADVFLAAVARVLHAAPNARILVVGDGPERGGLEALARSLGLDGRVEFLGERPDARELIAGLDVLVVSSRSEGSPLVALEAMEAGVPVVATAVGGIPDQIQHGRTGLLVPPDAPEDLAAAIVDLLADPARARALGEAGRRRALARFDHSEMVARVERISARALAETPGRPPRPSVTRGLALEER